MQEAHNFKMKFNTNVDTNKVLGIIKTSIEEYQGYYYENEGIRFLEDIEVDESNNTIFTDDSYSLLSNTFCNVIPEIAKSVAAKMENIEFDIDADLRSYNCGFEALHEITFANGTLEIKSVSCEEGAGYCEECMENGGVDGVMIAVVYLDEYDPDQEKYVCPMCGKELTREEIFNDEIPDYEVSEYKVIDGTLTLVNSIRK